MMDPKKAPDRFLPDTQIEYKWEKLLSSIYISSPQYGTMVTTVIAMDKHGNMFMEERAHVPPKGTRKADISL